MRLFVLIPLLLLTGCFMVKDFGEYWDKGIVDPLLAGTWTDITSRKTTTLVKRENHYRYANLRDPTQIKTLQIGEATFLMFNGLSAKGMIRYSATKDRVIIYTPNRARKADFINSYVAGSKNFVVQDSVLGITLLDENTVKMLEVLVKDDSYWLEEFILQKGELPTDEDIAKTVNPQDVPDPFAGKRELYKDVIGEMKGGAETLVPNPAENPTENPFIGLYERGRKQKAQEVLGLTPEQAKEAEKEAQKP